MSHEKLHRANIHPSVRNNFCCIYDQTSGCGDKATHPGSARHIRAVSWNSLWDFHFKKVENPGELLGDQLGEEEWLIINYSQEVTEVPFGRNLTNSRFTTVLEMRRHVNYYILRIIVPLMLISYPLVYIASLGTEFFLIRSCLGT